MPVIGNHIFSTMWSRWLVTNLVLLIYQITFVLGAGHMQNFKISPKPCEVNGLEGTCMFVWECIKSEGQHVGMCVDSFMFGSCCAHNLTENVILPQTFSFTRPTKLPIYHHPSLNSQNKPKPSHHISGMTTIERPHGAGTLVIRPSGPHHRPTYQKPVISVVNTTVKIPASPSNIVSDLEEAASVAGFTWNSSPQTTQWHLTTEPNFITKPRPPVWEKPTLRPKPSKPSKKPIRTTTSTSPFSDSSNSISSSSNSISSSSNINSTRKPTTINKPSKPQLFHPKPTKPITSSSKPFSTVSVSSSSSTSTLSTTTVTRPTNLRPVVSTPAVTLGHSTHFNSRPTTTIRPVTSLIGQYSTTRPGTTTVITTTTTLATKKPLPLETKPLTMTTYKPSPSTLSLMSSSSSSTVVNNESNEIDQHTKKPKISTLSAARGIECGMPSLLTRPETRIVGGKNAPFGRWPWQVSVRRTSFFGFSSTHRCGGALINENWIATAGHCVDDLLTSQIRIRVGEYDFSHVQEQLPYIERGVQKKVVHPKYNFFTYEYDLALVKLDQPLIFAAHVSPICLPATDDLLIGMNATVTGWGRLSEGGTLPSVLQEVSVPIVSNDRCKTMFLRAGRQEFIPDIFLCAGYETGGQDSCQGDSGGPLQVKADDGKYFLAGIISWGIGCAEANLPGVCTRISKFVPWIMENVT